MSDNDNWVEAVCRNCNWWFQFDEEKSDSWGRCVYHIGVKGTIAQRVQFKGTMRTRDNFGCSCFEDGKRE